MRRAEPLVWLPTSIAVLGTSVAWSDWVRTEDPRFLVMAVAMQVVAGAVIACMALPSRRVLIGLTAICVPILGPLASMFIDREQGRGGAELLPDVPPPFPALTGSEIAQHLVGVLAPCEALVSGDVEARRATLTRLLVRAGSEDIAILRWARNQQNADVAVEAALALADLEQRFEQRLREARAAVAAAPRHATHAALVLVICAGVTSGIVDPPLVAKLAAEARRHHLEANVSDPESAHELVVAYARLELAARRPDLALVVVRRALARSKSPVLMQLFAEAAYAARRFDLVPGLRSSEADVRAA